MAKGNPSSKPISNLFRQTRRFVRKGKQVILRSLQGWAIKVNRRSRYHQAGFVLPTVTMVLLVVVLLSLAITFRAFDRARDARYTKVSEAAFNAAAPALDRAQAKITQALQDVSQVSDEDIYSLLRTYTFGDEDQVQVRYDVNDSGSIDLEGADGNGGTLKDNEAIETAWRFPFDTDNNGKFDSFSIYGIFFRTPTPGEVRTPLDSRSLPLPSLGIAGNEKCAFYSGGVDSLVTEEGLTPNRGKFKKSIFAYTVTFPITKDMMDNGDLGNNFPIDDFEVNQGAPAYAPLEYQQDWSLKPLNGVVYIDDLDISPGPNFNLNVGLYAESNLITSPFGNNIHIFQITGNNSCFYDPDLSKIVVGGNVINGMIGNGQIANDVDVDLFRGAEADINTVQISTANQSTDDGAFQAMYNDLAYRERLNHLVEHQLEQDDDNDPSTVQKLVEQLVEEDGMTQADARQQELERYFRARLRKVPLSEVAIGEDQNLENPQGTGNALAPPDAWSITAAPVAITPGQLEATEPTEETQQNGIEEYLGDRVLVGNNQPALEYNDAEERWEIAEEQLGTWTDTGEPRDRLSRVEILPSAVNRERGSFWELAAARNPKTYIEGVGGLRVITGGGYYDHTDSFLPPPSTGTYDDPATAAVEAFDIVWPDTMPMSPEDGAIDPTGGVISGPPLGRDPYARGDLKMRATAVYHYADNAIDPANQETIDQEPWACVSSYYDNSSSLTAENMQQDEGNNPIPWHATADGRSNNGIVYPAPQTGRPAASTAGANGRLTGGNATLDGQASYVFPDGRFANKPLRDALLKAPNQRSIADLAAIDATLCAIDIWEGNIQPQDNPVIPHGAIREVAFLDARQVKAVDADDPETEVDETFTLSSPLDNGQSANLSTDYDLPLEDRQPLEVRATLLDIDQLRDKEITDTASGIEELNPEYVLPLSGIIYVSRDDALPDRSDRTADGTNGIDESTSKALSPVDYKLDPTRRPNGIVLVNGEELGRNNSAPAGDEDEDVLKEKGLTLVSNLPVYIKGDFNKHDEEEFLQDLEIDEDGNFTNFYTRQDINPNFACRENDPIRRELGQPCATGDKWRPATILADAITLLSDNFRFGFRNEGDFDLRNNAGTTVPGNTIAIGYDLTSPPNGINAADLVNETDYGIDLNGNGNFPDTNVPETAITAKAARQLNGFNAYNDFGVNGLSSNIQFRPFDDSADGQIDSTDAPEQFTDENYRNNTSTDDSAADSTYFNNFVTPIQRRGQFSEYVMEVCPKLPVSACGPEDWVIYNNNNPIKPGPDAADATAYRALVTGAGITKRNLLGATTAGTTAEPPSADLQRFPRRVAFLRNDDFTLAVAGNLPVPLGIEANNTACFSQSGATVPLNGNDETCDTGTPDEIDDALWFQTNDNGGENWGYANPLWYYDPTAPRTPKTFTAPTVQQPLLVPVLQIHAPTNEPGANVGAFPEAEPTRVGNGDGTRWQPRPANDDGSTTMEYNLVLGAGDVPGRPNETNGGLQNLARFLENWRDPTEYTSKIYGSFVQSGRSEYATAPYLSIRDDVNIFGQNSRYAAFSGGRRISYFNPPKRNWGFDVGLLAQQPDYFTRKFARLEKDQQGKFKVEQLFREVGRDDPWVKGLLCGKLVDVQENEEELEDGKKNAFANDLRESLNCSEKTNRTNAYDDDN